MAGGVDRVVAEAIAAGNAGLAVWGDLEWVEVNGAWRGTPEGVASSLGAVCSVEIQYRPRRPSEPTIVVVVDGFPHVRIDFNQIHQRTCATHIHVADRVDFYPGLWNQGLADSIPEDTLWEGVRTGLRYLSIDCSGLRWVAPPTREGLA